MNMRMKIKPIYDAKYYLVNEIASRRDFINDVKNLLQFLISNSIVEKAGQDYKRTPLGLAFIEQLLMSPPSEADVGAAVERRYSKSEI